MDQLHRVIHAAVRSGMGKIRHNNEDAYYMNGSYKSIQEMDQETAAAQDIPMPGAVFAVCDGMGGQDSGEVASYTAVSGMKDLQAYLAGRDFATVMQSWVRQADRAVANATNGGGCTMALLYFQEDSICSAHIGDSRIYRLHQGSLIQLTRDHSKVEMLLAAGMISPEEARTHPQRHVITRHIGMKTEAACEATIGRKLPVMNGDRYVLCTDGITDMLENWQIEEICLQAQTAMQCAEDLYQASMAAGGRDNLTVIVLDLEGGDSSIPFQDEDEEPTLETTPHAPSRAGSAGAGSLIRQTITVPLQNGASGSAVVSTQVWVQPSSRLPEEVRLTAKVMI